jgi:hypothetical protein
VSRLRRFVFATAIVATALLLSGCVYLRLLQVKRQMAAFDQNFAVSTDVGVQITCRNPVLLTDDIRWLGLAPESTRGIGSAEEWRVRWVKQLPSTVHEAGEFDIVLELVFSRDKLARVSIPERYFAVMSKNLLLDLLRSLGGAAVDKDRRAIEAKLASARPDLPGIEKLLGHPSSETTEHGETVYRYRYVPVTHGGLARVAVFDMAVHFESTSGKMRRWEGQTPVGRIGFNFEK